MNNENFNAIHVKFIYLPVINFALQQNRVSIIKMFTIENTSGRALYDIDIKLSAEPTFATPVSQRIGTIAAGETIRITELQPTLSTDFFVQLTERMAGHFLLEITQEGSFLFRKEYPIDILAFDQWSGISVMPEMLSAFITPNHPSIDRIKSRASAILEQIMGSPTLDEYQSRNPNQVKNQMAAIYSAIAEQEIVYSSAPASFEDFGQRIRLADSVMAQKIGNCLDMTLLYAAVLESVGIHPLVVVAQGHAFVGAWLVPDTFPDSVTDDASFLTKRTAEGINEIILLEATAMNAGNDTTFDVAVKQANDRMKRVEDFVLALDVKRSRFARIRPLPQRILNNEQWIIKENTAVVPEKEIVNPKTVNPYDLSSFSTEVEVTKQLMWERKLLDLSLRNNLLNTRITKNTLQLISVDLDEFENALSDGSEFKLMSKPGDWENSRHDFGIYQSIDSSDPITELLKTDMAQKRLRTYLSESELEKSLTHLYRSSRLSVEENGANTLYMAFGLLRWYETVGSERPRYAPILLFPVEIIRKSAAKGYIIRSREEDAMLNITLLEMLRQNFGINIPGLEQLPRNENGGVSVRLIYSIFRDSIKNQPKWDVEEEAILGIFSFSKFIMWNDIHNNADKLIANKLVKSLVTGKVEFEVDDSMTDASELDRTLTPADLVLPISADSSQLEAVYEAINDKTFILHGPPGTGKSQTITNIIANALYQGKRVLFVAEKMAALEVVQSRLKAIGLAPFCLELHSNKAKKTAVLSQLKATAEVVKNKSPENFGREANRLFELRKELNVHIDAMHKPYLFGLSLYQSITRYLGIETRNEIRFPQSLLAEISEDKFVEWQDTIDLLASVGNAFGHPHTHPLAGIEIAKFSPELREEGTKVLAEAIRVFSDLKNAIGTLRVILGDEETTQYTEEQVDIAGTIFSVLLQIPDITQELLLNPKAVEMLAECNEVINRGKTRDRCKTEVLEFFTDDIFNIEAKVLLNAWNIADAKWFIPRMLGQKKVREQLSAYIHNGSIRQVDIRKTLINIIKYKEECAFLSEHTETVQLLFGKLAKPENEQWDKIQQVADNFLLLNDAFLNFTKDGVKANRLKASLAKQVEDGMDAFRTLYRDKMVEFRRLLSSYADSVADIADVLEAKAIGCQHDEKQWIANTLTRLKTWHDNLDQLKDWYQWLVAKRKAIDSEIGFVAEDYEEKNIPTAQLKDSFSKGFYRTVIDYIAAREPGLDMFKGKLFNDMITKYKELNDNFIELTKKELNAKLSANLPAFSSEAAQNSEVGILMRNIKSNGRGVSIRSLFDQIPTLLPRMFPCMLMSPISVAQYINPDAEKFDLIVFDEASQMPTYEAVGAIARGKNMIIVGDPKQMPPTNFFSVNTVDEDNLDKEDLESILDDSLALSIPSRYLLWHYRSKHESLIAFSNSEYYDNKLLTFPSPDNIESKVRMVHVEGHYDKGKSRQNRKEAEAVVAEIKRRLLDPELRKRSIGVVTFSSVQQTLIADMVLDMYKKSAELEKLSVEREEPLFIKNLENVQGDERDVILFSVGYGPDESGRVSMNFGPLNRVGGERRLNVAVSRARYEMTIFSTLRSDQIDLNRTSAVGVEGLKRFLEFAERGERINRGGGEKKATEDASIEHIIAKRLREEGYDVHTNIGSSGYKIDIGIVDKDTSGKYILGIICDGENYRRTKTTRDREIVQNSVLRMLNWNICRVWTLDWWDNSEEVISTIEKAILKAKKGGIQPIEKKPRHCGLDPQTPHKTERFRVEPAMTNPDAKKEYVFASISEKKYPSDLFFFPENESYVKEQIQAIIDAEAPISHQYLQKRVLAYWDIARVTSKVTDRFDEVLDKVNCYKKAEDDTVFIWKNEEQMKTYDIFRNAAERTAADIAPEEIANAMRHLMVSQVSLPVKDLLRITANLFGFGRMTVTIETAMQVGLVQAEGKGYVRVEGERVRCNI